MARRDEVVGFLNLFKACVNLGWLEVKNRDKNRQALIDLGITPDRRREILLGLTPEDYVAGPMPDDTDDTKEVMVQKEECGILRCRTHAPHLRMRRSSTHLVEPCPKEVWVFGPSVQRTEVHIKLRVVEDTRHKAFRRAVVWSFHPAEHPMRYPLRGGRR